MCHQRIWVSFAPNDANYVTGTVKFDSDILQFAPVPSGEKTPGFVETLSDIKETFDKVIKYTGEVKDFSNSTKVTVISTVFNLADPIKKISQFAGLVLPFLSTVGSVLGFVLAGANGGIFDLFGSGKDDGPSELEIVLEAIREGFKKLNERIDELDKAIGERFESLKKFHAYMQLDEEVVILQRIKNAYVDYMALLELGDHPDIITLKETYTENFR